MYGLQAGVGVGVVVGTLCVGVLLGWSLLKTGKRKKKISLDITKYILKIN